MTQQAQAGPTGQRRRVSGTRRRLINAVDTLLPDARRPQVVDVGELIVRPGDHLVVDTPRGKVLGLARSLARRELVDRDGALRVVRRAGDADLQRHAEGEALADQAMRFCIRRIRKRKLAMKVVKVEYTLDRGRVLVYFSSEERVDFRQLVRDLASELNVRIEMRQIGVRDGAGIIGGIGPCGKELCCSSFLESFSSISIRHAKTQNISLNPQKVTGMCGRLKCCLVYEHGNYKELKRYMPKRGRPVLTPRGPGSVESVDILARTVRVRFPGMHDGTWHLRDLVLLDRELSEEETRAYMSREQEILARRRARRGGSVGGEAGGRALTSLLQDTYVWADESADLEKQLAEAAEAPPASAESSTDERARGHDRGDEAPRRTSRRRRRRKGGGTQDERRTASRRGGRGEEGREASSAANASNPSPAKSAGEAGSGKPTEGRKRRRRRRRGGGKGGSGGTSGGSSSGGAPRGSKGGEGE